MTVELDDELARRLQKIADGMEYGVFGGQGVQGASPVDAIRLAVAKFLELHGGEPDPNAGGFFD